MSPTITLSFPSPFYYYRHKVCPPHQEYHYKLNYPNHHFAISPISAIIATNAIKAVITTGTLLLFRVVHPIRRIYCVCFMSCLLFRDLMVAEGPGRACASPCGAGYCIVDRGVCLEARCICFSRFYGTSCELQYSTSLFSSVPSLSRTATGAFLLLLVICGKFGYILAFT